MSDFKVGDIYYELFIKKNTIAIHKIQVEKIDGTYRHLKNIVTTKFAWIGNNKFETKQECIDAFKKKLDEL